MKKKSQQAKSSVRVDFSKVAVQVTFEGEPHVVDYRKDLGNTIRANTGDIGLDELAREIYFSEGPVEIPEQYVEAILSIVRRLYIVPAQRAFEELLTVKES